MTSCSLLWLPSNLIHDRKSPQVLPLDRAMEISCLQTVASYLRSKQERCSLHMNIYIYNINMTYRPLYCFTSLVCLYFAVATCYHSAHRKKHQMMYQQLEWTQLHWSQYWQPKRWKWFQKQTFCGNMWRSGLLPVSLSSHNMEVHVHHSQPATAKYSLWGDAFWDD